MRTYARPAHSPVKPFWPACERNKGPILEVLQRVFAGVDDVLEIGSGSGQHAVWFAAALPHLAWRTSDLPCNHAGINAWIDESKLDNVERPLVVDVGCRPWPLESAGGAFSANTAHIMHWPEVVAMFDGVVELLSAGARFVLYGPFARDGSHTGASNAAFDRSLRAQDPGMGLRDLRDLERIAAAGAMMLEEDIAMPSNNRTLVWRKAPGRTRVAVSGRLRMYDPVARPAKRRRAQSSTGARSSTVRKPLHEPSRR